MQLAMIKNIEGKISLEKQDLDSILKELNLTTDNNYIVVDKDMRTSNPHIYAAGDIIKKDLYQLVTAISEGAIAANSVRNNMNK